MHIEQNAQDGKNIYVDRDYSFAGLPPELMGADWIQAGNSDAFYSAVDLIQIEAIAGTTVSVAHDDRLPRPAWLTSQFQPTNLSLAVKGRPMKIFQHPATHEESLTLGSNADDTSVKTGNMYIVFVNAGLINQSCFQPRISANRLVMKIVLLAQHTAMPCWPNRVAPESTFSALSA